jgi:hypothetical protein
MKSAWQETANNGVASVKAQRNIWERWMPRPKDAQQQSCTNNKKTTRVPFN